MARWEIAVAAKNAHRQGECCDLEGLAWHHINPVCRLRVRGNGLPGFVSLTTTVLLPSSPSRTPNLAEEHTRAGSQLGKSVRCGT